MSAVPGSDLRPGVRRGYLVRRRLRLAVTPALALESALQRLTGFNRCVFRKSMLMLEYDASRIHIDQLLQGVTEQGAVLDTGPLQRFRLGWYRYLDTNIAANARDESSSACSQSPLRHR